MSEAEASAVQGGPTAGAMLRQAREAAGLHVASLAVALKVPVRKLEALEQDRHDLLSDAVFVRALAASVCRTLKIDPQPVLDRLPRSLKPRLMQDDEGINTPFRSPADGPKPPWFDQLSRPVALSVVALLLGAIVLMFLPAFQRDNAQPQPDPVMPPPSAVVVPEPPSAAPAMPVAPSMASPPVPRSGLVPAPATAPAALPDKASSAAAAQKRPPSAEPAPGRTPPAMSDTAAVSQPAAGMVLRPASTVVAPGAVSAASPNPPVADAAAQAGIVVFRTRASSWVQVTDARGNSVLRRLMEPGESAAANGSLPLTVTIGSAEATEVQVRGKPFNLGPVSRDNVARFEVK